MKKLTLLAAGVLLALIGFIAVLYFLPGSNCCGHEQRCEKEWKDGDGRMHKEVRVEIRDGEGMQCPHGEMHGGCGEMQMHGGCGDMKMEGGCPHGDMQMQGGCGGDMKMKMDSGCQMKMPMMGCGGMHGCCCCCMMMMHGGMDHCMMNDSMKMDTTRMKMKVRGKI